MFNDAVWGVLALFLGGAVFIVVPALLFARVEKSKKLEAELEQLRREQPDGGMGSEPQ